MHQEGMQDICARLCLKARRAGSLDRFLRRAYVLFIMPLGYRRSHKWISGLSLVALAMGFLSMELDSLLDHPHADAFSCKHCDRGDGRRAVHLTRNECGKERPPCNACFFHNLLIHCLIPNSSSLAVAIRIIPSTSIQHVCVARSFLDHEGIRGPPLS